MKTLKEILHECLAKDEPAFVDTLPPMPSEKLHACLERVSIDQAPQNRWNDLLGALKPSLWEEYLKYEYIDVAAGDALPQQPRMIRALLLSDVPDRVRGVDLELPFDPVEDGASLMLNVRLGDRALAETAADGFRVALVRSGEHGEQEIKVEASEVLLPEVDTMLRFTWDDALVLMPEWRAAGRHLDQLPFRLVLDAVPPASVIAPRRK